MQAIRKGIWKPSVATWWIWLVNDLVILYFAYKTGSRWELALLCIFSIGALIFAILSIKYGSGSLTRIDYCCLIGAGLSIAAGKMIGNDIGLILSVIANMIGSIPTYMRVIPHPEMEDKVTWLLFFISSLTNLMTIKTWVWQTALFPLYCVLGGIFITTLAFRKISSKELS